LRSSSLRRTSKYSLFSRAASVSSSLETSFAGVSRSKFRDSETKVQTPRNWVGPADVMKGHRSLCRRKERERERERERETRGWWSSNPSLTLLEYIKVAVSGDDTAHPRALQRPLSRGVADRIKRRDNNPIPYFLPATGRLLRRSSHTFALAILSCPWEQQFQRGRNSSSDNDNVNDYRKFTRIRFTLDSRILDLIKSVCQLSSIFNKETREERPQKLIDIDNIACYLSVRNSIMREVRVPIQEINIGHHLRG